MIRQEKLTRVIALVTEETVLSWAVYTENAREPTICKGHLFLRVDDSLLMIPLESCPGLSFHPSPKNNLSSLEKELGPHRPAASFLPSWGTSLPVGTSHPLPPITLWYLRWQDQQSSSSVCNWVHLIMEQDIKEPIVATNLIHISQTILWRIQVRVCTSV